MNLPTKQKPLSDEEAIAALHQGGASADVVLRRLYNDNRAAVGSIVLQNGGSQTEAADVFQEAVIAFYENVRKGKFKGESAISTYLYSIARFNWLNRLKRKNISAKVMDSQAATVPDFEPDGLQPFLEKETEEQVLALFDRLGSDCRAVLVAVMYHHFSMKEVAEQQGYENDQVARNKKYLCLKKLKELIKGHPHLLQILTT